MSIGYVRQTYGVPAKRGGRIEFIASDGELLLGTIVGAKSGHLRVRLDGNKRATTFHPTWNMKYLPDGPDFGFKRAREDAE